MVLVAASLGLVLYSVAGISGSASANIALTALTFLILYNAVSMRLRDRTDVGSQIAGLSRGTTDLARQVAEFGRRLAAVEGRVVSANSAGTDRIHAVTGEINELGVLVEAARDLSCRPSMALKANPNILECLYSPMVEKVTPLGGELITLARLPEPDDFPDFQRLRHVAVQEDRTRHPQPWRGTMETRHAPAAVADDWRSHSARSARACAASKRIANDCWPSNVPNCRGQKWTLGAKNCTRISSEPLPKPNCLNAPTTKRRIVSSSRRGGKWQFTERK